jgi:hypothetical protein
MADPRRIRTRRAVLSYEHLKQLTSNWPDLLIKDYQGILQDSSYLSDEIDGLELRVIKNEEDIDVLEAKVVELEERIEALEYRVFDVIETTSSMNLEEFKTLICRNTDAISITLKENPILGDEVNIKRTAGVVNVIGVIDGLTNVTINRVNYSMKLVFNGTDWSEI